MALHGSAAQRSAGAVHEPYHTCLLALCGNSNPWTRYAGTCACVVEGRSLVHEREDINKHLPVFSFAFVQRRRSVRFEFRFEFSSRFGAPLCKGRGRGVRWLIEG